MPPQVSLCMTKICSAIFILSAVLKSINIHSFAMETGDYIDMYMP